MAITSGSELYTAVTNWLSRSDTTVTARVGEFITLFEAHANRVLRVRQMETSTTLSLSTLGVATLPTDYLDWRAVEYNGSKRINLEYADRAYMSEAYPDSPTATPAVFTIEGSNLQVMPAATSCVTFRYYQKITSALTTATGSTNWLLGAHPDLYLFGTLAEAQGLIQEPEKGMIWKARRDELIDEVIRLHQKTKSPGSIRPHGVYTP